MAIELIKPNAIFYEIPKTGTTWVRHALTELGIEWRHVPPLGNVCARHGLPCQYPQAFSFRFCSIRHPVGWYESYWRFSTGVNSSFLPDNWYAIRPMHPVHRDFAGWIRGVLDREPGFVTRLYETFCGPFGWSALDAVLRQESLASDLADVLAWLGYGDHREALLGMPRANESIVPRVRWPPDLLGEVTRAERPAIDRWYQEGPNVKLELGGGKKNLGAPWLNVDIEPGPTVDVVHDLDAGPLPFDDNTVEAVYTAHCLEHLRDHRRVLNEICRVCRLGAHVEIRVPHWLGPLAMTTGHEFVISDHEVGFWSSHPECFFRGSRRLVEDRARRHYQREVYFDELRTALPATLSDDTLTRLFPGCCHEVHYHFTVELWERSARAEPPW